MSHLTDRPDDEDPTAGDPASADPSADDPAARPGRRERPTSRQPAVVAAALAAVNVAAFAFVGSHRGLQYAGEQNASVTFLLPWPDVLAGLAWVVTAALLVRAAWRGLGVARHVAAGGLAAGAAVVPAVVLTAAPRVERYQAGLETWAATRLDYEAVRAWAATTGGGAGDVPSANWPPAVAAAEPSAVERAAGSPGGVVLRWGAPGGWAFARRVFVAAAPRGAPADDGRGGWRSAAEGVYVGLQREE